MISRLLRRDTAWASALYLAENLEIPPKGPPVLLLPSLKLFRGPGTPHVRADPFLYVRDDALYMFYEVMAAHRSGHIEGVRSVDGKNFEPLGIILREPHHVSYPYVFDIGEEVYMLPETSADDTVKLYRFDDFPRQPVPFRTLLHGTFVDASPIFFNDVWYVFATSPDGLELYFTEDIVNADLVRHPCSPVTKDPAYRRCGGVPLWIEGHLVRPAQDCSRLYGGGLSLMKIEELTTSRYRETLWRENVLPKGERWNRQGGHHISTAVFRGKHAVAIDGQTYDYYVHKIVARAARELRGLEGIGHAPE